MTEITITVVLNFTFNDEMNSCQQIFPLKQYQSDQLKRP